MSVNWKRLNVSLAFTIILCALSAQVKELVVLHSNDTHSQIEPNSLSASRDAGQGGIVRREAAIEQVRKQNPNVLLVDAGDFVQGSPYFNFFGGEVEIQMMNKMGYEVGTLGNHEFDNGLEALAKILAQAQFPFVCSNYDVSATPLAPYVKKTVIFNKGGLKIGVLGIGVNPEGLIAKKNFGNIVYSDPVEAANKYASELKQAGCDLVIMLSHIGYYDDLSLGDQLIASHSSDIDLIIGGHSHTNLKGCVLTPNKNGKMIPVAQTGKSGFRLGRINIEFSAHQ